MQVSIPKEILEDIAKKYQCSQDEALSAYLNAQSSARETYEKSLDDILGKKQIETVREPRLFTPQEIKIHLDKYIIGQEEYKKRICIAAAYHFAMLHYIHHNPGDEKVRRFRKKNTLISGPSGSGKTYCIEVLGDLLQVPTLTIDSTDYTEAGYVGKNADDMIRELIDMAPGSNRKEQARFISENGGIIFIDEIDKKAREEGLAGHDISREGFQRSILKLMERKLVPMDSPYSAISQIQEVMDLQKGKSGSGDKMVSTENILFILGGSFERGKDNLESIIKKRVERGGYLSEEGDIVIRGFGEENSDDATRKKYQSFIRESASEDYIKFGLLPELVGRTPIRTFVNLLSKNDLVRIMKDTKDSILHQYELEFNLFGVNIQFTDDAVSYAAELAENKKTGARALVSVWEKILTDFQFELPGSRFNALIVTKELCNRPAETLLGMLKKSPFLDFIEKFKNEFAIELSFDEGARQFVEETSARRNMEISAVLQELLRNAVALNYMHHQGPFIITREILEDPDYFDHLFAEWYQKPK